MDLFIPVKFKTAVQLSSAELTVEFEKRILEKLRATHEQICTRFGYIRAGSLEILRRSAGQFVKQHFNGHIRFEVLCKADICNPGRGSVVPAVVRNKNALGIHAESMIDDVRFLDIIVPKKSAGIKSQIDLETVSVGDTIYVEIMGKRYSLNDRKISIIGRCIPKPEAIQTTVEDLPGGEEVSEEDAYEEDLADDGLSSDGAGDGDSDDETAAGGGRGALDVELAPGAPLLGGGDADEDGGGGGYYSESDGGDDGSVSAGGADDDVDSFFGGDD